MLTASVSKTPNTTSGEASGDRDTASPSAIAAVFLKLLVLLVPREMRVEHTNAVKAMTDSQLEAGIEALTAMLAQREAGANAKVIDAVPEPVALPAPSRKARRKRGAEAKASPLLPDEQGESE